MRYALVLSNVVENVMLLEDTDGYPLDDGHELVPLEGDLEQVGIGWERAGGAWTAPVAEEPPMPIVTTTAAIVIGENGTAYAITVDRDGPGRRLADRLADPLNPSLTEPSPTGGGSRHEGEHTMTWCNPTANMHIPPGGEFGSWIANGAPRSLQHSGIDLSRYRGNDVVSIGDGVIIAVGAGNTGWGNHVWIDHGPDGGEPDGPNVPHIFSGYAHMLAAPPFSVGDATSPGTILGGIGRSGVEFDHLHFTMAVATVAQFKSIVRPMGASARGLLIDPLAFLNQYATPPKPADPRARVVGTGGAKRREEPTTSSVDNFDPSETLTPGAVVSWDGFVRSTLPGGQPGGDNIWLVKDGLYTSWTAMVPMYESQGPLANIPDLGTYPDVPAGPTTHQVIFALNDGSATEIARTVIQGERVAFPQAPTRAGFTFLGWFSDAGAQITADTVISRKSTFTARWQPIAPEPADPTPMPEPETPVEPNPEEEPPVTTPTQKTPLTAAQLARLVKQAQNAGVQFASEAEAPVIPDGVAKPLWIVLGVIAVSVAPIVGLTVLDYGRWNAEVGGQFSTIVGAWVGTLAAVLGLSRFAKTK